MLLLLLYTSTFFDCMDYAFNQRNRLTKSGYTKAFHCSYGISTTINTMNIYIETQTKFGNVMGKVYVLRFRRQYDEKHKKNHAIFLKS